MKKNTVLLITLPLILIFLLSSCSFFTRRTAPDSRNSSDVRTVTETGDLSAEPEAEKDTEPDDSAGIGEGTEAETDIGTEEEGSSAVDPSAHSFGYTVTDNTNWYYWKYHAESIEDGYLFGNFHYIDGQTNELVCLRPDGSEKTVVEHTGYGKLALYGGYVYFSDGTNVYSVKTYRGDVETVAEGTIIDVSPNGEHIITQKADSGISEFDVRSGKLSGELTRSGDLGYRASSDRGILCSSGRDLYEISYGTAEKTLLYSVSEELCPDDENSYFNIKSEMYYSWYSPEENALYFVWTHPSGGTLGNYVEGPYVRIFLTEGREEFVALSEDTSVGGGMIRNTDGSYRPAVLPDEYNHKVVDGDRNGKIRVLLDADEVSPYGTLDYSGDSALVREKSVYGGYAFLTVDNCTNVPEKDMGWRPYYQRNYTVFLMKDLVTGELREIYRY